MRRYYEYLQRDSMGLVSMHIYGLKLAGGVSFTHAITSIFWKSHRVSHDRNYLRTCRNLRSTTIFKGNKSCQIFWEGKQALGISNKLVRRRFVRYPGTEPSLNGCLHLGLPFQSIRCASPPRPPLTSPHDMTVE